MKNSVIKKVNNASPCRTIVLFAMMCSFILDLRFLMPSGRDLVGAGIAAMMGLVSSIIFVLTSEHLRTRKVSRYIVNGILKTIMILSVLVGFAAIGFIVSVYVPWILKGVAIDDWGSHVAFVIVILLGVELLLFAKTIGYLSFDDLCPALEPDKKMDPSH